MSPERFVRMDNGSEMPFIGEVLLYREGREIVIKRILDLEEDLYLADHCLVNTLGYKPVSAQMPVLPMTFGMEMAAEVAACLAPGLGFLGFEEFRAARWIGLEDCDALPLHIIAQVRKHDEAAGMKEVWVGIFPEEQKAPSMEARVTFGRQYRMTVEPQFSEFERPKRYPLDGVEMYREKHLFHGPLLQCISGDVTFTEKALLGELTVSSDTGLFRSFPQPELLTDPAVNDGIGQLVGMWSLGRDGRYALPISVGKIEYYRTTPPAGTKVPVFLEVSGSSSILHKVDVEVQDGEGAVWFRVKDWTQWIFDWSERVIQFNRNPLIHCVSRETGFFDLTGDGSVACEVAKNDIRGLTLDMVARSCLHVDEMKIFRKKAAYPKRQIQWLLGRVAAKDAVRLLVAGSGEMVHPVTFMIEKDDQGQPSVSCFKGDGPTPHISISHCDDRALAIAHTRPVGIDLERIIHREEAFFKKMGTQGEHALLAPFADELLDEWVTRIWCAKEAVGKMLGTGVDGAPQRFEAVEIDAGGRVSILHHSSSMVIVAETSRKEGFIAACAIEQEAVRALPQAQTKVAGLSCQSEKSVISQ